MTANIKSIAREIFTATTTVPVAKKHEGLEENIIEKKVYTLDEISWHDSENDCWVIIYDRVYDVTNFLDEHPGGKDLLLEYAGREASVAFRGFGHSNIALKALEKYRIGDLPEHQRIFRKPGGYRISGIPE